jgi:hypothetical protein
VTETRDTLFRQNFTVRSLGAFRAFQFRIEPADADTNKPALRLFGPWREPFYVIPGYDVEIRIKVVEGGVGIFDVTRCRQRVVEEPVYDFFLGRV